MLHPVNEENFPAFRQACAIERVFGSKCLSAWTLYRHTPSVQFRVDLAADGSPASALFVKDGVMILSSDNRTDPAALAALVREYGVTEIDTNWEQCAALRVLLGGVADSSFYMAYPGGRITADFSGIFVPERLDAVFAVLQQSHEYYRTHLQFAPWSADLSQRIALGLTALYQLDCDGVPVGTGCIVSQDDRAGAIAAVAVIPAYRGRGLGTRITQFLVNQVLDAGKQPLLISGYDEVAALYRQIGFVETGRWGELYL